MEKAYVFRHSEVYVSYDTVDDADAALQEFESAYRRTHAEIDAIEADGDEGEAILAVYKAMLEDPDYLSLIRGNIKERKHNAAWAVEAATDKYVSLLERVDDDFFKERIADLRDISGRLISEILSSSRLEINVPYPAILVADYLQPSEMISMDLSNVKGLCLDKGGITSHIAILARSMNIPSVFALSSLSFEVSDEDTIAMDGKTGNVVINPDRKTRSLYRKKLDKEIRKEAALGEDIEGAVTADGFAVKLMGNIEGLDGIESLIKAGADGIGLFRTEFLMMLPDYADNEKRSAIYRETVERMSPYGPVTFRTYDIGGDKIPNEMKIKEENPILGWRAVRLCLEEKDLFRDQLISILKASAGYSDVRLMFPMISGSEELQSVIAFLDSVKDECREKGIEFADDIKIGTMIEVPSAAITADVIARYVDFMSIGTNDLIQYTIAVDRSNEKISYLYRPLHPAVLRLLKHIVDSAHENGIPVSMCGEMAGYADYLPILIGLGLDELSMAPSSITEARRRIRKLSRSSCASFVNHVLSLSDAKEIEKALKEFNCGKA